MDSDAVRIRSDHARRYRARASESLPARCAQDLDSAGFEIPKHTPLPEVQHGPALTLEPLFELRVAAPVGVELSTPGVGDSMLRVPCQTSPPTKSARRFAGMATSGRPAAEWYST